MTCEAYTQDVHLLVWILRVVPCRSLFQGHHWEMQFWRPFDESPCLQWLLVQGFNELTQNLKQVQKFHCNWLQMFGWNLLPQIWPCNVQLHHQPHVWFWTPICKKWASYPWGMAPRTKCCWQLEGCIPLTWPSPTHWHFCHSTPLPRFEVFLKKLWWPFPPLWWPPTNHGATPYVVFGAFVFVHLVVVHLNLHFVV